MFSDYLISISDEYPFDIKFVSKSGMDEYAVPDERGKIIQIVKDICVSINYLIIPYEEKKNCLHIL